MQRVSVPTYMTSESTIRVCITKDVLGSATTGLDIHRPGSILTKYNPRSFLVFVPDHLHCRFQDMADFQSRLKEYCEEYELLEEFDNNALYTALGRTGEHPVIDQVVFASSRKQLARISKDLDRDIASLVEALAKVTRYRKDWTGADKILLRALEHDAWAANSSKATESTLDILLREQCERFAPGGHADDGWGYPFHNHPSYIRHVRVLIDLAYVKDSMKAALRILIRCKCSCRNLQRDYKAALSPFRRFPAEILLEIFHWVLDFQGKIMLGNSPTFFDRARPRLGQVCRQWRAIVINSGSLWSTINYLWSERQLSSLYPDPTGWVPCVHRVQRDLQLTHQHPITLTLHRLSDKADHRKPLMLLAKRAPQFQHITIVDAIPYWGKWLDQIQVPFPLLRSLTLSFSDNTLRDDSYTQVGPPDLPCNSLLQALQLVRLTLKYEDNNNTALEAYITLPFPQFRECYLTSKGPFPSFFLSILDRCPGLIKYLQFSADPIPFKSPTASHAHLRIERSHLVELATCSIGALDAFTFPNLRSLLAGQNAPSSGSLNHTYRKAKEQDELMGSIYRMLDASRCSLTALVLEGVRLDVLFMRVLRAQRSLERLDVSLQSWLFAEQDEILSSFFAELGRRQDVGGNFTFLPSLKILDLCINLHKTGRIGYQRGVENKDHIHFSFADATLLSSIVARSESMTPFSFGLKMVGDRITWSLTDEQTLQLESLDCVKEIFLWPNCLIPEYDDHGGDCLSDKDRDYFDSLVWKPNYEAHGMIQSKEETMMMEGEEALLKAIGSQ